MQINRISILGAGQMGLSCADMALAGTSSPTTTLWDHNEAYLEALGRDRTTPRLPGFVLPQTAQIANDLAAAIDGADLLVLAAPAQATRNLCSRLAPLLRSPVPLVSVSKGVEVGSLRTPLGVAKEVLGADTPCAIFSGPTIAAELAQKLPATMLAASSSTALAKAVQQTFTCPWVRIYTGNDPLGVELAGATKNVIALAAGVLDGLQMGINAKSALLARGLAEIVRLGEALGADRETFFGVAGVGDLATTCFSPQGRNRSCGEALGKGETIDDYLSRTGSTVEGVQTARALVELATKHELDLPITAAVHAVLFENVPPAKAIESLMQRPLKPERVG